MKSRKNIVKEVFIFIVLLILVLLILAVALYDFVPTNINVAEIKEYNPDSKTTAIKQEIAYTNGGDISEDSTSEEFITSLKSYSIDASELAMYAQKNYDKGNSNPFEYGAEATTNTTTDTNTTATTTTNTSATNTTTTNTTTATTTTNTTTSNTTTGTFFEKPNSK